MRVLLLLILATLTSVAFGQSRRTHNGAFFHTSPRGYHAEALRGGGPPANDACANAEVVAITADCTSPTAGNNAEATNDGVDASCDDPGADLLDVWYTFNSGPEDTVAITLTPSAQMTDWAFVMYDGCAGAEIICLITPGGAVNVVVTPGTDYWIRVYSNPTYGDPGPFTLCVSTPVSTEPPPPNDICANVLPQPLAIGNTLTFIGTNTGATDNEGFGYPAVWEAFTLTACADVKISYCGTVPAWDGFWLLLYGGCIPAPEYVTGSYDSTACADGNFTLCFVDLPPGSYHYPVVQGPVGAYSLNISAEACGTDGAVNDECAGAIPLSVHPDCQSSSFTNPCATQSLPAVTCGTFTGDANDDVWYSFVATASDISIGGAPHGAMDIVLELFSGSCGSLTSIACGDVGGAGVPDDLVATGLNVGTTYYFRVYDFRLLYAYVEPGYDLCVMEGLGSGLGLAEGVAHDEPGVIYPNPTNGLFTMRSKVPMAVVRIEIMDATGRIVHQASKGVGNGTMQVDASFLPQGAYMVRCTDGSLIMNERLIIE